MWHSTGQCHPRAFPSMVAAQGRAAPAQSAAGSAGTLQSCHWLDTMGAQADKVPRVSEREAARR